MVTVASAMVEIALAIAITPDISAQSSWQGLSLWLTFPRLLLEMFSSVMISLSFRAPAMVVAPAAQRPLTLMSQFTNALMVGTPSAQR